MGQQRYSTLQAMRINPLTFENYTAHSRGFCDSSGYDAFEYAGGGSISAEAAVGY